MERVRKSLRDLGLTPQMMAGSLSFGLVWGVLPLYIPTVPTIALGAIVKLLGLSLPAALIGLQIATPVFMVLLVPYVRVGEWLSGSDPMDVSALMSAMKESIIGALGTFGSRLGLAVVAWAASAPLLFALCYFVSLPLCRGLVGKRSN
mmetsp:Transcript_108916/g.318752  ORF Transcript_108916/g.318752 Transcript_108916/m.318752 type:complete len:148 (+) Transcript_108916:67-510(+)